MTERGEIRTQVGRGLAWLGLARSVIGGLDLLSHIIILALWISPEQLGIAMLAGSLFAVLDLATDLGLSAAVIQRDDHTPERISTVFWMNLGLSMVLFGGLLLLAPLLGHLQDEPVVGTILIVYGGKLLFQNIYFVPQALMKKQLRFKELSMIRIAANLAEFFGKIAAAWLGAGVWFHIIGRGCHTLVTAIGVQLRNPWRPRAVLRIRDSMNYLTFGLKQSASQILFHAYTNVDYQVVGYYFGATANGYYTLAYTIVLEPVRMLSHIVVDVAFPAFARLRFDRKRLIEQFVSFIRFNLITILPLSATLMVIAHAFIGVFWPERWMPTADAIQILGMVGVLRALSFVVPPLLDGVGRPSLTLLYMVVAAIASVASFIVSAEMFGDELGFLSVAWAWVIGYPIAFVVLFWLALTITEMRARDLVRRTWGIVVCVAVGAILGEATRRGLVGAPELVRLLGVTGVILGVSGALLWRWQGINPQSIRSWLRHGGG